MIEALFRWECQKLSREKSLHRAMGELIPKISVKGLLSLVISETDRRLCLTRVVFHTLFNSLTQLFLYAVKENIWNQLNFCK